jgi:hypothetical protein
MLRAIVAASLALLTSGPAWADDKPEHQTSPPGPMQHELAKMAGDYTTSSTFRTKPGEPGIETKGSAKLTSVVGGRFLLEEGSGVMMNQPYTSIHLTGFNDGTGKFESTWIYTGSNGMMRLVGTAKGDGKTIDWTATADMPQGNTMTLYVVTQKLDDDHFTVELCAKNPDGSKGTVLETSYARKK